MSLTNVYGLCIAILVYACVQGGWQPQEVPHRPTTEHVITFFIQPCFCSNQCVENSNLTEALEDPGFLNRNHMKYCLKSIQRQGINVVYYGMATHTDAHGQVTFPRKQTQNNILLVVTAKPHPLVSQGRTVNKWIIDPQTPAAFYTYTQGITNGQPIWYTQKIEIPANRVIPAQAIIIIANPEELIIHEGASSTVPGPNIVLPPIYTKKTINLDKDALLFLNINEYFSHTQKVVNYSTDRYAIRPQEG